MRQQRGRNGEELVVQRIYARSRHERRFAAAAYEIVVPKVSMELFANLARAEEKSRPSRSNADDRTRRPA